MNTYRLTREDDSPYAFEIENIYVSPKKVAAILEKVNGVSDIRVRKLFSANNDVHLTFKFNGKECVVWEPYGDNSRYWIGPSNESETLDIPSLEEPFLEYQPPLLVRVIGDLLSLKFVR